MGLILNTNHHGLLTRRRGEPVADPSQGYNPALDPNLPHNDLGPELNAIFWALTIVALGFMCLRIYCKFLRGRYLWWDDYVLIASWIALAVSAATTSVCVALDYGKHGYDMRPENLPKMPFIAVFAGFFSVLSAAWSKTSFALTLIRLSERWMRLLILFILITVNAILGTAMLFMWIKCWPIPRIWDSSVKGKCIPASTIITLFQWSAGYSGTMDIILALCPWVMLWKMTMTTREKFGVAIAMSMGIVAGVASIVKMVMLPKLSGDPTETVAVTIWGGAEGAITIMAASIPVLRTLFRRSKDFTPLELTHHEKPRPTITLPMNMKPLPPTPPMEISPLRIGRPIDINPLRIARPMDIRVPETRNRDWV